MLIDSHCHLEFPDFEQDIKHVLARADEKSVEAMLTISTSISDFANVYKTAALQKNIYASVGIHPCNITKEEIATYEKIVALCASHKIIGIGETGLDYYHSQDNKLLQIESFKEHIKAAQYTKLPLIIHTRNATKDTLDIVSSEIRKANYSAVIHCFTESMEFARAVLDLGFYISFSGIITFKNAHVLQDIAKFVPIERMLVETDAPYLAPVPHRGKRNEPSYVSHTAEFLAELKYLSYEKFCIATTNNFYQLFNRAKR